MTLKIRNRKIKSLTERKRASAACDRCRKRKAKCEGGHPCQKCAQSNVECVISSRDRPLDPLNYKDQYTEIRKYNCKLERIIQYLNPSVTLDFLRNNTDEFEKKVCLSNEAKPLQNFNKRFVSTTDQSFIESINKLPNLKPLNTFSYNHMESFRESLLPIVTHAVESLPSDDRIRKLIQIYLNICETNYFYVHHQEMYSKIEKIKEKRLENDFEYFLDNWDFLCIVLITIAISSGFEYMEDGEPFPELTTTPGIKYYYAALPFASHLIDKKSIESVQGLILFGIYITTNKLENFQTMDGGYLFMNLALEIAIANKLHEPFKNATLEQQEVRKRLWWTVYTMERRHGVNLGKQDIIKPKDITVSYPSYVPELNNNLGQNNYLRQASIIDLNFIFREITEIQSKFDQSIDTKLLRRLLEQVEECKLNFPPESSIEKLDPTSNEYRAHVHLNLTYYLAKIYIGKPFLLYKIDNLNKLSGNDYESAFVDHLSSVCVDAAFCSIELLSELQKHNKLGLFSCSDINFCNISLFSVLLFLKLDQSENTVHYLRKGLKILSLISKISPSARSALQSLKKLNSLVQEFAEDEVESNNGFEEVQVESFPITADSILNFDNSLDFNDLSNVMYYDMPQLSVLSDFEELLASIDVDKLSY